MKLFNGRSHGYKYKNYHIYVAAYSMKQAAELVSRACYGDEHPDNISVHEIKEYYSKGAWGNQMNGIEATEPCVYVGENYKFDSKPIRVI